MSKLTADPSWSHPDSLPESGMNPSGGQQGNHMQQVDSLPNLVNTWENKENKNNTNKARDKWCIAQNLRHKFNPIIWYESNMKRDFLLFSKHKI